MDTPRQAPDISWSDTRFGGAGLRTRFRPRTRIRPLFFTIAPWLDAVLLIVGVLFAIRGGSLLPGVSIRGGVLTPGMRVDLPAAPFRDGSDSALVLVVNPPPPAPVPSPEGAVLVFFDESRYDLARPDDGAALRRAVAARITAEGDSTAVLFVDRRVAFGDLASLLTSLRRAGASRVCFAAKPLRPDAPEPRP